MSSFYDNDDATSIASTAVKIKDPVKKAWCQTQWTNLSHQARRLGLAEQGDVTSYFDPKTMLLDKTVNKKLWQLLNRLYNLLGPDKAPYAHPVMHEAGRIEWHNYADGCMGVVAEIIED